MSGVIAAMPDCFLKRSADPLFLFLPVPAHSIFACAELAWEHCLLLLDGSRQLFLPDRDPVTRDRQPEGVQG